ncbi:Curli production assembly/transport component CsgG [uncultured Winogradskyella sp.]|uniref:Curli production assembly/transport component CsgG n=1 Tax=uncultured Winogradskyella sp. TaxID=395353 RepID=UPI0026137CB7|nr:Curli production assembly/transport component CsgG [uncultured Winogradskyella sp.]
MIFNFYKIFGCCIIMFFSVNLSFSQETRDYDQLDSNNEADIAESKKKFSQLVFFDYRGTNVLETTVGLTILQDNLENKESGFYFRLGYKRAIIDHLFIGLSYNSYVLSYNDIEQKLESFDFNLEFLALPYDNFTPFLFGGFGYNTLRDIEASTVKLQGGFGLEFIVVDKLGLKFFAEYNYNLEDKTEFVINDEDDDTFLRLGFGLNFYFGGETQRQKRLKEIPTQMKTNSIAPEDY